MNSQKLPELPEDFFLVMISGTSCRSVKGSEVFSCKVARFEENLFHVPLNRIKLIQHYVHFQIPCTISSRNYYLGTIFSPCCKCSHKLRPIYVDFFVFLWLDCSLGFSLLVSVSMPDVCMHTYLHIMCTWKQCTWLCQCTVSCTQLSHLMHWLMCLCMKFLFLIWLLKTTRWFNKQMIFCYFLNSSTGF